MRYGAIDIGNSRIKILTDDGKLIVSKYSASFTSAIREVLAQIDIESSFADFVWGISSVVPSIREELLSEIASTSRFVTSTELIEAQKDIDVSNVISAGHDRILGIIGARSYFLAPYITIDCGTAITINYVDEHSIFQGGAILPGLSTSLQALHALTDQLPLIKPIVTSETIGNNTVSALEIGNFWGSIGAISTIVQRIGDLTNHSIIPIVMTGGEHLLIYNTLGYEHSISVPNLVLEGILASLQSQFKIYE